VVAGDSGVVPTSVAVCAVRVALSVAGGLARHAELRAPAGHDASRVEELACNVLPAAKEVLGHSACSIT